ncbi:MAG: O-antigen ligase family protein, partial [Caldilineaceae bacterium]|nr:O-antigen ligase family protein [Caldilineaceae bacterium]
LALFLRRDERRATGTSTPWTRMLLLLAALVQGAALLLTFSKGALFIAMPVMLATIWLGGFGLLRRQGRATRPLWALAGLAALLLLALLPFLGTARFQRIFDLSQGTGFLRLQLWRSAWQMALDHPWFGVGPDNFLYAYRSTYILPAAWQEPNMNHPHNFILDWWTRLGLIGLTLAAIWFSVIVIRLWQGVRKGDQPVVKLGLLAAVIAALAHGLIDASYALPDLMLAWVLIALMSERQESEVGSEECGVMSVHSSLIIPHRIFAIPSASVMRFISPTHRKRTMPSASIKKVVGRPRILYCWLTANFVSSKIG